MGIDWDWQVFLQDPGTYLSYWQWMLSAWGWSATVAVLALIIPFTLGCASPSRCARAFRRCRAAFWKSELDRYAGLIKLTGATLD